MRSRVSGRRFSALLYQGGAHLFEYAEETGGFALRGAWDNVRAFHDIGDAAQALMDLVRNAAPAGDPVSLTIALDTFGTFYHAMALPPAPDEVLRPVIEREAQRIFGVEDPVVAFTRQQGGSSRVPLSDPAQRVRVAGVSRDVVESLQDRAGKARVKLEGVVPLPLAIRRAYDALDASAEATALLVCLPGGPHLSYFLDGSLEMAIEAPLSGDEVRPNDPAVIAEQVDRGAVFLRQQFGGAHASRVLLAAPPEHFAEIAAAVQTRPGLRVEPFGEGIGAPAALAALGAVLEARSEERLDLIPRAPSLSQRVRTGLRAPGAVATAACLVAFAAAAWGGMQVTSYMRERDALHSLRRRVEAEAPALASMRQVVERRAAVAAGVAALNGALRDHRELTLRLRALAEVAPPEIRFDSLVIERTRSGWDGQIHGRVEGSSARESVRSVEQLYRGIREQPAVTALSLDQLDYVAPAGAGAPAGTAGSAMRFGLRFVNAPLAAPPSQQAGGPRP